MSRIRRQMNKMTQKWISWEKFPLSQINPVKKFKIWATIKATEVETVSEFRNQWIR